MCMPQLFFVLATVCHTRLCAVSKGYFGSCFFFYAIQFASLNRCSAFCFAPYLFLLTRTFSFLHRDGVTLFSLLCLVSGGPSSMADKRNGKGERESIDRLVNSCLACLPSLNGTITDVYLLYEAGLHQSSVNDPILSIIQLV